METLRFLLRCRDGKYSQTFDAVFQSDDLHVITSAPQAPRNECPLRTGYRLPTREVLSAPPNLR